MVLAILLACAPAAAATATSAPTAALTQASTRTPTTTATSIPVPALAAASVPAGARVAVFGDGGGPACAPAAPERGGTPAVPARAWGEHAQVPPGRAAPEEAGPPAAVPVRPLVRGPDRPAPDRLELCVMRV
ncbi:hypothetical protein ADK75_33540 [Streptomyces virginiae]|uniref:Uncharacterized protein n=1 Tax=Streptomyces virginiae TaxID=1961 RepID=A0A0L8M3R9_STRVG|nr:hypothetical protein [Streptomyces virginiae]KOG45025.1 hypothetical protein ADK75_33540 [Streptomyces virginiae]